MIKRITINITLIAILLVAFALSSQAQNERKFIRKGNNFFEQALSDTTKLDTTTFSLAETEYRKALDKRPEDLKWKFNLGGALYKQKKFEEAASGFGEIIDKTEDKMKKSQSYHNLGNSLIMQNKLDESIEAYKDALRNNPNDLESKYNLVYAMNLKKQQEQQQQQQNQDQNKDQNKDQQQNQDQKQNQDQNKDQQDKNQDQNKQNQNQDKNKQDQQKQQQPQQQKISKENAERLLQALQNDEQKIQEKVKKAKAQKAKQRQTDKDW